jgi:hypothetical protein
MILLACYERFVVSAQLQENIHQVKPSRSKEIHWVLQHEGNFPVWLPVENRRISRRFWPALKRTSHVAVNVSPRQFASTELLDY